MEIAQLRNFVTVVEAGSVSKASVVVHLTQPALSRQIRGLEREVGRPLFTRSAFGVEPTAHGLRLHQQAQVILEEVDRVEEVMRAADEGVRVLRVGIPQGVPRQWGTAVLDELARRDARLRLSFHEATTEEQRLMLQTGLLDLGLVHTEPPELSCQLLLRQRMGIAVPAGSAWGRRSTLSLAELDGHKVMAHAIGEVNVEVARMQAASAAVHAVTEWVFRRFSEHTHLIALASGIGAVLVTQASASRHLPDWHWIPLSGHDVAGEDIDIRTWVAWRQPAASYLISTVQAMADASVGVDVTA